MKTLGLIFSIAALTSVSVPAAADPWKNENGHGYQYDTKGPPKHAKGPKHKHKHKHKQHHAHHDYDRRDVRRRSYHDTDDSYVIIIDVAGVIGALSHAVAPYDQPDRYRYSR